MQADPDQTTIAGAAMAKKYLSDYYKAEPKISIYWGTTADFLEDLAGQLQKTESAVV